MTNTNPSNVCRAYTNADGKVGGLKYNTKNKDSKRHAGPELAKDLKARNLAGLGLKCYVAPSP